MNNIIQQSLAVSVMIGESLRYRDVNNTNRRSTLPTTRGYRTLTMATRTTTTRTIPRVRAPSAASNTHCHADFSFEELLQAYYDCRRNKRCKNTALNFELNLERNLTQLYSELTNNTYTPGKSICFVVMHPKPREVWAAEFRDRIVHHLLYNKIAPRFHAKFIADSCACIPGRGTLYAVKRLESKVRSITQNWQHPAYYLKCDLANFFVSINKNSLHQLLIKHIPEPYWQSLAELILFHDPRQHHEVRGNPENLKQVPQHKQLASQPKHLGLPIGNLNSQFFANVYLNELDQYIKHHIKAKHYVRYVDDFIILHANTQWLNAACSEINEFLKQHLQAELNPTKTVLQPITRGIDFVGQIIKPWHTTTRRKTLHHARQRIATVNDEKFRATANSYFGLLRQASHSHQQRIALSKAVMHRGRAVNKNFTKVYR